MTARLPNLDEPVFSGRDEEIAKLTNYLHESLNAHGRTVFITGEAGIGKTRLAHELIAKAKEEGFQILEGQCLPASASPYLAFEDALRGFFSITKEDSEATTKEKISKFIKPDTTRTRESLQAVELLLKSGSIIRPHDTNLTTGEQSSEKGKEPELGFSQRSERQRAEAYGEFVIDIAKAELVRQRFLQIVSSLIVEMANVKPVLLFIDDLHWADPSSLALLHLLSRRTRTSRALIVGTYRSEDLLASSVLAETLQQMSREDLCTSVNCKPLEKQAYSEILRETFRSEFSRNFLDKLYAETEGSPLFAIEMLKLLVEEGSIRREDSMWVLSLPTAELRIPDKVKDVLARRVARLSDEDRRVLELASVIGDNFESLTVQNILALDKLNLLQSLSSMERIHSLIQSRESGYRFTHSKVREVIYDQLSPELRKEYHLLVGEWIEKQYSSPEESEEAAAALADHFSKGKHWARALAYSTMAGDRAMQIHAHQEALQAYSRALEAYRLVERPLPPEISSSLHERNALAAMASGKIDEALGAFDSLAEEANRAGNEKWYGKAKLLHGWASFWNKDLERALQDCAEALSVAKRVKDKTLEGRSQYLTGTSLLAKGLRQEANAYLNDSLRTSQEAGDKVTETQTLLVLLMEGFQGN